MNYFQYTTIEIPNDNNVLKPTYPTIQKPPIIEYTTIDIPNDKENEKPPSTPPTYQYNPYIQQPIYIIYYVYIPIFRPPLFYYY